MNRVRLAAGGGLAILAALAGPACATPLDTQLALASLGREPSALEKVTQSRNQGLVLDGLKNGIVGEQFRIMTEK